MTNTSGIGRFFLNITDTAKTLNTSTDNNINKQILKIYSSGTEIFIIGNVDNNTYCRFI